MTSTFELKVNCVQNSNIAIHYLTSHPASLTDFPPFQPVPIEAVIPFAVIATFFTLTGSGLSAVKYYTNDKKPARYGLDYWESQMMERDRRLTGSIRGQSVCVNLVAPPEFSLN
ncbi:hypothetical protein INT44_006072, partial [Umbelopsis vinacea]